MKEESVKLVNWIKIQLAATKKADSENYSKAIHFLDSLPEIESHLCKGGYIQDANGIPCCDGDKILFKSENGSFILQLIWDKYTCSFLAKELEYTKFHSLSEGLFTKVVTDVSTAD